MKFSWKNIFNRQLFLAWVLGMMRELVEPADFLQMQASQDRSKRERYLKRVIYLLSQDKDFLKLFNKKITYIVDTVFIGDQLHLAVYDAVPTKGKYLPDDVRRRKGLVQVHSENRNARARFRYLLRDGDLFPVKRNDLHFLFTPNKPLLVYRPGWGDELRLLLNTATNATKRFANAQEIEREYENVWVSEPRR